MCEIFFYSYEKKTYVFVITLFYYHTVAHADYKGPPKGYKPMEAMKKPRVVFDYLTPNDALPYPGLVDRTSEAKVHTILKCFLIRNIGISFGKCSYSLN